MWATIKRRLSRNTGRDIRNLEESKALKCLLKKYGTNRTYTSHFLKHMLNNHNDNAQFDLYIESELGSLKRSRAFIKSLCYEFRNNNLFAGKDCLDIGCSSGNSLIAFAENAAAQATGIELCAGRFQTAEINIAGCSTKTKGKIKILREDIQNEEIATLGQFDIIFCNDVLEHVENPLQAVKQICRLLKNNSHAFAFISLRNYLHPHNIIHEPHYDFPGMVLLPHELAQKYYSFANNDVSLKYEVYHWMSFSDYQSMFKSFGKKCNFYGAINPDMSGINSIENEAIRIPEVFNEFSSRNNLNSCLKKEIEKYINAYLSELQSFAHLCKRVNDKKTLEMFYLRYVIFDIPMIVTSKN